MNGVETGDWSDFGSTAGQFAAGSAASLAAIAGAAALFPAYAPLIFGAAAAWGIYEGITNGAELFDKIRDDWRDGRFNDWFGGLGDLADNLPSSPLVIDLDGDGIELTTLSESAAYFDLDVNGFAELTGWVAADDALLALDTNGDGVINDGSELFGDQTGHEHGFLALAVHDENLDGVIDASDSVFSILTLWNDLNGDGVSDVGEMQSLATTDIVSISLGATSTNYEVAGNAILWESDFTRSDGTSGTIVDAFFEVDRGNTVSVLPTDFEFTPLAFMLPIIAGAGNVHSSMVAFSLDQSLAAEGVALVELASTGNISQFNENFRQFIFNWVGVDNIDPTSRGSYVDARELAVLEELLGRDVTQYGGPNPRVNAGRELSNSFDQFLGIMAAQFLAQVPLSNALLNSTNSTDFVNLFESNPLYALAQFGTDFDAAIDNLGASVDQGILTFEQAVAVAVMVEAPAEPQVMAGTSSPTVFLLRNVALEVSNGGVEDSVVGSETADVITVNTSSVIFAGAGDDAINGSSGRDVYFYRNGDGSDTIQESGTANDQFVFSDLNAGDVQFAHNAGGDLVMTAGAETITVTDHFRSTYEDIEEIVFADGTVLDLAGIRAKSIADQKDDGFVRGSSSTDVYLHTVGDGSYTIQEDGSAADQFVFSDLNAGDVQFAHNAGGDLVMTAGAETITVTDHFRSTYEDIEEIVFADGTVLDLAGIRAKSIADQKDDGFVRGSSSTDVYLHTVGDGSYTIQEDGSAADQFVFSDLNAGDVQFAHNAGGDLVMTAGAETITVTDHFRSTYEDIEEIVFADGTVLDLAGIRAKSIADQKDDGFVRGSSSTDVYLHTVGDGSYTIQEDGSAADQFVFSDLNAGDVQFAHNAGGDLVMTAGAETITVTDHFRSTYEDIEEIVFADGTVLDLAGIRAKSIADQKDDGFVRGSSSTDVYLHTVGDGSYTIQEDGSAADQFVFSDLNAGDVQFAHNAGGDLVMTAGAETITVTDHFRSTYEDIEEIVFADGTVLDLAGIRAKSIADQKDDGFVRGSSSTDVYLHTVGDGSYTIQEDGSAADQFVFSDLNAGDVQFAHNAGGDLVMTAGAETITVTDHFRSTYEDIEEIVFADGTVLDLAGIRAKSIADQKDDGFVRGSSSTDVYLHTVGDGSYTIQEDGSAADQFVFSDLNAGDVQFAHNAGGDLVMTAGAETITVTDHFRSTYEDMETISFADGTTLDLAGISGKVDDDIFML